MELDTIAMPKTEARKAFLDYKEAVHDRRRRGRDEEVLDVQLMRAYRELARGHQLIKLSETIAAGGTTSIEHVESYWDGEAARYRDRVCGHIEVPLLAVARADSAYAYTSGIRSDGSIEYRDRESIADRNRSARITLDAGTFERAERYSLTGWGRYQARATAPLVPPPLRPKRGSLANYHLLWGPAEWSIHTRPMPPGDPALLKRIDGDLFAVVAVWDLTPVEQAVLGGLRG